jgi:hypothetical protein
MSPALRRRRIRPGRSSSRTARCRAEDGVEDIRTKATLPDGGLAAAGGFASAATATNMTSKSAIEKTFFIVFFDGVRGRPPTWRELHGPKDLKPIRRTEATDERSGLQSASAIEPT